jgi:hypothetical protein
VRGKEKHENDRGSQYGQLQRQVFGEPAAPFVVALHGHDDLPLGRHRGNDGIARLDGSAAKRIDPDQGTKCRLTGPAFGRPDDRLRDMQITAASLEAA